MRRNWDIHSIKKEALKYKVKEHFRMNAKGAFNASERLGILDEVCSHMSIVVKQRSFNEVLKIAKKYQYKGDFRKNEKTIYKYASNKNWINKITSHMKNNEPRKINFENTNNNLKKLILKWKKSRSEFQEKYPRQYKIIKQNKELKNLFDHNIQSLSKNYTIKELKTEAKKYKSRFSFQRNNKKMFWFAKQNNLLDKVCSHMSKQKMKWSNDEIFEIARKENSYSSFARNYPSLKIILGQRNLLHKLKEILPNKEICLREKSFHKEFSKKINKHLKNKKHILLYEPKIIINKNTYCVPDYTLKINNKNIALELKHDESRWEKKNLQAQLKKYKKAGFDEIYLISKNGKYGMSQEDFLKIINKL